MVLPENTKMTKKKQSDNSNSGAKQSTAQMADGTTFEDLLYDVGQNKNKDSFIRLFHYFAPRIKSFLMKGGAHESLADELAQETMLNIWNKAESYDPAKAAASTWIFTIARNKRIDALRKKKFYSVDLDALPDMEDKTYRSPVQEVSDLQKTETIAQALESLPPEQADLIKRSYFEDKSHQEIADETGLPLGTVKSRIRIALKRLRESASIKNLEGS
jgi:RNA polymerase sigma-70 factor (ECF subfamily)